MTVLLGALAGAAPFAMDVYLTSMPSMARALAATPSELQLTLSVYMYGWGVGQLFAGPLSDRFGRRPALLGARLVQVRATRPNVIIANYARLLRTPPFAAYTGVAAFGFSGLLAFLAGSAFVFVSVMGESEQGFGLLFGSVMLGNITGSTIGSRIVRRLGIERMVRGGTLLMLVAGLALGALALLATRHPLAVVVPMFVCMVAFMMTMPPATAGALTPFPQIARQRVVAVVVLPVRHCVERGVRRRLDVRWHRATDDADDCRVGARRVRDVLARAAARSAAHGRLNFVGAQALGLPVSVSCR